MTREFSNAVAQLDSNIKAGRNIAFMTISLARRLDRGAADDHALFQGEVTVLAVCLSLAVDTRRKTSCWDKFAACACHKTATYPRFESGGNTKSCSSTRAWTHSTKVRNGQSMAAKVNSGVIAKGG
jgi:hypothetical protein